MMQSVREIKALAKGASFEACLLVRKLATRTAKSGQPFLSMELGDKTGSFTTNLFSDSAAFGIASALAEGTPVHVMGMGDTYADKPAPRISSLRAIDESELAANPALIENLVAVSSLPADAMARELAEHVAAIGRPELRATVEAVLQNLGEVFHTSPAAVSMHHAYRHGLLEHTLRMCRTCRALLPLYPEVDADLALAGVIVHDTGKALEYSGGLSTRKTRVGILQGHVVLGYRMVRAAALKCRLAPDLVERLEHLVLSHQGELEWGAAVMAATPEAVFVSMVDNLDARMGMVQNALRMGAPGAEFSEYLPGLKAPLLLVPPTS